MAENTPGRDKRLLWLRAFRVLFTLCTLCTVVFIFTNSMETGTLSGGKSAAVTVWINRAFEALGTGFRLSEHFVRKLGHLSEYALLGFCLMLTLRVYTRRILTHLFFPLFWGLAVPVTDEAIQLFTPGRSGEVRDILIDFAGVLAGIFCALFLLLLVRMINILRKSREKL